MPKITRSILLTNGARNAEISTTIHEIEDQKAILESDPDKLEVLFKEMVQMCLW